MGAAQALGAVAELQAVVVYLLLLLLLLLGCATELLFVVDTDICYGFEQRCGRTRHAFAESRCCAEVVGVIASHWCGEVIATGWGDVMRSSKRWQRLRAF
jgi:hypothetical protein